MRNTILIGSAVLALGSAASAQSEFDNVWAKFNSSPSSLDAGVISNPNTETDMAWGDLDQDGWLDVVVVRKQPFTSPGKRTNILLMNENGVLTDRTIDFASFSSEIPTDLGFRTATNDRDVVIADVDGDGWMDVITATTISDGDPKHIGHPRVYMNRGEDLGGNWLGLDFQDSRIPQLFHFGNGSPQNPRFCSVDAGDVTGDGLPDLYFGDYDSGVGNQQPANADLNDRLLVNDGAGFFTDQSQSRMTSQMLLSAFGAAVDIEDMNGDGVNDIVKQTALNAPQYVAISYNNLLGTGSVGNFNNFDNSGVGSGAPYHVDTGDLNADGRPDIITSDDGQDRFRVNLGNDVLDRAEFSGGNGGNAYEYVVGGDTGFASNALVVDIDGDGWGDTIHADIDVDIPSSNRTHIYHNRGGQQGTPAGGVPQLIEEGGDVTGNWTAVKGLTNADLEKVHDFVVDDINNDGLVDLVLSRENGTEVYLQEALVAQADLGFGGLLEQSVVGDDLTEDESIARFEVRNVGPNGLVNVVVGAANAPAPFKGGTLVPLPILGVVTVQANVNGVAAFWVRGAAGTPASLFVQSVWVDGSTYQFSNANEVVIGI